MAADIVSERIYLSKIRYFVVVAKPVSSYEAFRWIYDELSRAMRTPIIEAVHGLDKLMNASLAAYSNHCEFGADITVSRSITE